MGARKREHLGYTNGSFGGIHMAEWDFTTDFVSIGSGGGGLASALAVNSKGYDALVLEKREVIGGSTAMSGGCCGFRTIP